MASTESLAVTGQQNVTASFPPQSPLACRLARIKGRSVQHIAAAALAASALVVGCGGSEAPQGQTQPDKPLIKLATLQNFIVDPVVPDNGMPDSPAAPQTIGRINLGVDVDGNAIETVDEQDVRYFDGKYYLYGQSFACGSFNYAPGTMTSPTVATSPRSYYRYCGLVIYSSDDLMNWKLEKREFLTEPATGEIYPVKKPRVIFSPKTGLYTMWFLKAPLTTGIPKGGDVYAITQSSTPVGPWGPVTRPSDATDPTLNNIGPDFTINSGPDGSSWLVTSHAGVKIFKLNEEKTGTLDQIDIALASGTISGGIGLHYRDGWWYLTGSSGCGNCISAQFYYLMARDPKGPWLSPETGSAASPLQPALLAEDVGRSQVHGAVMLPDTSGAMHTLIPATHYRSSPTGAPGNTLTQPGDNNLALSGHFYFPLQYALDGRILPLQLKPSETFPLAHAVATEVPPTYEAVLSITDKQSVVQSWSLAAGQKLASVLPSMFQRTVDLSPLGGATANAVPQDPHVNAPLQVNLELPNGTVHHWTIDPRTVAWAPAQIPLNLPVSFTGEGRVTLTLSTAATNGGYGVAVGNKSSQLPGSEYAVVNAGGKTVMPKAQMLVKTAAEVLPSPRITAQPKSLRVTAGSTVGFSVGAQGVGNGYQWTKDSEIILSLSGTNDSTAPTFRMQHVTTADSGTYAVQVFNQTGSVTSTSVTLEVLP